jgi:hypothetical protein
VVDTRVDIINITIEELVRLGYELPVFSTWTILRNRPMREQNRSLHRDRQRLSSTQKRWLDGLLETDLPQRRTLYHQIKQSAKKASRKHLDLVIDQLNWLESLPDASELRAMFPLTSCDI